MKKENLELIDLKCPNCKGKDIYINIYSKVSKKVVLFVLPLTFIFLYFIFYILFDESIFLILLINYLLLSIPFILIILFKKGVNRCNNCNHFFSSLG
jgi:ABC-type uncharacterized transport system permease subunit